MTGQNSFPGTLISTDRTLIGVPLDRMSVRLAWISVPKSLSRARLPRL